MKLPFDKLRYGDIIHSSISGRFMFVRLVGTDTFGEVEALVVPLDESSIPHDFHYLTKQFAGRVEPAP